ncbi:MAG: hypothetical protein U0670_07520 [Anaerolineae bacterium]
MSYQIIVDNEWATVRYEPKDKYLYHTFHKPIVDNPEALRDIMYKALDTLISNGAEKWLSDDRNNAAFKPESVQEAVSQWGPAAAAAGWKYWALVVPQSIAGRAAMTDLVEAFYGLGVRVAVFTDVEDARAWLETV